MTNTPQSETPAADQLARDVQAVRDAVTAAVSANPAFAIEIKGENYNASLPADALNGLYEFQYSLYRAVAYVLHGEDDVRRLSKEDLQKFELVFEFAEGSTLIEASIEKILEGLAEGMKSMDSAHKAAVAVLFAIILTSGYVFTNVTEVEAEARKAQVAAETSVRLEEFRTQQMGMMADALSGRDIYGKTIEHLTQGGKQIVKGASDAESISQGAVVVTQKAIEDVSQRAKRQRSKLEPTGGTFMVIKTESKETGLTRFMISEIGGEEYFAYVMHDMVLDEEIAAIWDAAKSRSPIYLEIVKTVGKEGAVKAAQIVGVNQQVAAN